MTYPMTKEEFQEFQYDIMKRYPPKDKFFSYGGYADPVSLISTWYFIISGAGLLFFLLTKPIYLLIFVPCDVFIGFQVYYFLQKYFLIPRHDAEFEESYKYYLLDLKFPNMRRQRRR